MRSLFWCAAIGFWLGLAGSATAKDDAPACGNHGTAVQFLDTPSEAARKAQKEEKLVFVLHVSGNFEDPGIT